VTRGWRDTADRLTKLVALASSENEHEAARAREQARRVLAGIDLELVGTLDGQRAALVEDCRAELRRLYASKARPNAGTARLVERAQMLLSHYARLCALPAIVTLARLDEEQAT
jgi:hypothetical protein